ncbi:importin 13 [Tieghemostelium lacteum]|uniref:Importin 13 n=1 Tax=Tieghemostelium lacteum TaxID=361077 RepID=A0A152A7S8_TIELA|nr:importin 13 [Tieghemostelium lacteum]|eukprot:KYR02289.1 importin 13 [Tieghemostelium lacteum]
MDVFGSNGKTIEKLIPEPSVDVIKAALIELYQSHDPKIRDQAQNWLIKFQTLPIAWDFSSKLLLETDIMELQYFGASTLEYKLKHDWTSLPKANKAMVLGSVVNIVKNVNRYQKHVVTRICVALSIITIYTYPDVWKNAIIDVIQLSCQDIRSLTLEPEKRQHNLYDFNKLPIVLEFLSVLPHELKSQDLSASYKAILTEIKIIVDLIYQFLLSILILPNDNYKDFIKMSFKSLSNWIRYVLPSPTILRQLFHLMFQVSLNGDKELLEPLILVLENSTCQLENQSQPSNNTQETEEAFRFAVETSLKTFPIQFKQAMEMQDMQKAKAIFNLFVQFLTCNNQNVFCKEITQQHLEVLLSFVQIGDIETNSLLFPLLEEINGHKGLIEVGKPILEQFLLIVLDRSRVISMYSNQDINKEDDEIKQFRTLTCDAYLLIQNSDLFPKSLFHNHLLKQLEQAIQNNLQEWQFYESMLFYISSLSECMGNEFSEFVPQILAIIPRIPVKSLPLVKMSISLVGKYPFFLKNKPEYLEKVIFDLIPAFQVPDLLVSAGSSFSSICLNSHCAQFLFPHTNKILELCEPALKQQQHNPDIIGVYDGLLRILKNAPNPNELNLPFQRLIGPIVQNLHQLNQANNTKDKPFLLIQLKILNLVSQYIEYDDNGSQQDQEVKYDKTQHPLYLLLKVLLPIFGNLIVTYNTDGEVMDTIAGIYRWFVLFCKGIAYDFLGEILNHITQSFVSSPSPFFFPPLIAFGSYSKLSPEYEQRLAQTISTISHIILNILKQGATLVPAVPVPSPFLEAIDPNYLINFSYRADLSKLYLQLLSVCYKHFPQCLDGNIVRAIDIYIIYNLLDTKDIVTLRCCWSFLSTTLTATKSDNAIIKQQIAPLLDEAIQSHAGKTLIRNLLVGMTSVLQIPLLQHFADIPLAFCTAYPKLFRQEASKILLDPTFPNDNVALGDKHKFLSELQRPNNPMEYRYSIRTFSVLCGNHQRN